MYDESKLKRKLGNHTMSSSANQLMNTNLTMNEVEEITQELIALKQRLTHLTVSVFEENQSKPEAV